MRPIFRVRDSWLARWILLAALAPGTEAYGRIHVAKSGNDANNGSFWWTAKKTVQAGIDAAVARDEVWVAQGTYVENITLKAGVVLYGGFAGGEDYLSERDWKVHVTVLDGNQAGIAVSMPNATTGTRLDGFRITHARWAIQSNGYPTIVNNTITENRGPDYSGGILFSGGSATIANNTITANGPQEPTPDFQGFPIYCANDTSTIVNNAIVGNAGTLMFDLSRATIANNTIAGNFTNNGGVIYSSYSSLTLTNNIIAFNSPGFFIEYGDYPITRYNCFLDNGASAPPYWDDLCGVDGNVCSNPLFVNAAGDDYHLAANSPCRNAGDPAGNYSGQTDMDGQSRVINGRADIGADEFTWSCDFDADGDVDGTDYGRFAVCFNGPYPTYQDCLTADFDHDRDVDNADYAVFQNQFNGPNRSPRWNPTPLGTVRWYFSDPPTREIRTYHAGDTLQWAVAVEVSEDTKGLAAGDFDVHMIRLADDARMPMIAFGGKVTWFDVLQRGYGFASFSAPPSANGPGMVGPYVPFGAGTDWFSDGLYSFGLCYTPDWGGGGANPWSTWGVGLASRRNALLAYPDKGYALFYGLDDFIRYDAAYNSVPLQPGCYRMIVVPQASNVLPPTYDYGTTFDHGYAVPAASMIGDSFVFCYEQGWFSPKGDFDADGDVDGADFGVFAGCFNGTGNPVAPGCLTADLNGDLSVDGIDYGLFAGCFNGTGNPSPCQ